jgi:starch synthase
VYFIDNDEYFKRKATFAEEDGSLITMNVSSFAKGVGNS